MTRIWILLMLMMASLSVSGDEIPKELAVWQDWVKYDQSFRDCPYFTNDKPGIEVNHVCAWPQQLKIEVGVNQASFNITWDVQVESWVPIPGDSNTWPQTVTVNSKLVPVQKKSNQPRVFLEPGVHKIKGEFHWQSRPESIDIPSQTADINLMLEGEIIKFPVLEDNALWLGEVSDEQQVEANSLEIEVNRLIIDGHPMTVFMALDLEVSGVARNEKLGRILFENYQITDVGGDLNAYVDQAGDLWAQLKPGYNEILIGMNIKGWPSELKFEPNGDFWPNQEIWAYQDNKNIRLTQIEGVSAINPEQTSSRWFEVPNYLINAGDVFVINEQKRGTLNQSEQLDLVREAWLSFDGESFRTKDHISGNKFGSWRLNADSNLQLLSALSENENLLITKSEQDHQGVELRKPEVNLEIEGEIGNEFKNLISGWDINFETIRTNLYLPHGYMALATQSVDSSRNVWLEQWRLWDIFIIMLLTVLSYKVIGVKSAIFAFIALLLGYQGLNMPLYTWGNLIIALALIAWIPEGRWLRMFQLYAILSVLGLLMILVPYVVNQARLTIHPQLEYHEQFNHFSTPTSFDSFSPAKKSRDAVLNQVHKQTYNTQNAIASDDMYEEQGKITVTGSRIRRSDLINRYQTDAILQAGKGTPVWRYNEVVLQWDGPITADQQYRLYLITPWMRVTWRLLLIAASVSWLLTIIAHMRKLFKKPKAIATTGLFLVLSMTLTTPILAADFPPEHLLAELKTRVFPESKCLYNCAAVEKSTATVKGSQLQLDLTYHTQDTVVVPVPDSKDWLIKSIKVNNQTIQNRLKFQNKIWIKLDQGINQVELNGELAKRNSISINFPLKPGHITAQSQEWQFAGMDGFQLSGNTLQLIATSQSESSQGDESTQSTDIKPFVKLTRSITFDDQWYVNNYVSRVAPKQGVLNVTIPLLENEFPMEKVQQNEAGDMVVNMPPDEEFFHWRSRLERLPKFNITAIEDAQYLEEWDIVSSPQWHVKIAGIPMVASENLADDYDDYFVHMYLPRPGESIQIDVSRPAAINGKVLAIDAVDNTYSVGKRTIKTWTHIKYHATQGGRFEVNLDPDAIVKKVTFDGVESNLSNENGVVTVSFLPGKHRVEIEWHLNQEFSLINTTPTITLNDEYSNLSQTIKIPRDRWLLWGHSSGVGPAFLYWGELLVFLVLAFFLAKIKYSPLKVWQWVVLGCAFGTFSWMAFAVVATWLFFVGWKHQFTGFESRAKSILLQWFSLFFTLFSLGVLIGVVAYGLLSYPDMGIAGKQASATQLHWYLDFGLNEVPSITLLSLHLWWYKLLILLWSIWVSFALLNWLKQLLESLNQGDWWPKSKKKKKQTAKQE